jgi:hypothetical protein
VRSSRPVQTYRTPTTARLILALCAGLAVARAATIDVTRQVTLEAIHNLENPRNLTRVGPRGELGPYQFRESTWRDYSAEPFLRALDRSASDLVAVQHFEWLKHQLEAAHLPVTTYNIALAWNGGIGAAISGRAPRAARNYAQRAENLASVFAKENVVADGR